MLLTSASWAGMRVDLRASYSSTRTWPRVIEGQARTVEEESGERASRPLGLFRVLNWSRRARSEKRYTYTRERRATTTRSRRSLQAMTFWRNDSCG